MLPEVAVIVEDPVATVVALPFPSMVALPLEEVQEIALVRSWVVLSEKVPVAVN